MRAAIQRICTAPQVSRIHEIRFYAFFEDVLITFSLLIMAIGFLLAMEADMIYWPVFYLEMFDKDITRSMLLPVYTGLCILSPLLVAWILWMKVESSPLRLRALSARTAEVPRPHRDGVPTMIPWPTRARVLYLSAAIPILGFTVTIEYLSGYVDPFRMSRFELCWLTWVTNVVMMHLSGVLVDLIPSRIVKRYESASPQSSLHSTDPASTSPDSAPDEPPSAPVSVAVDPVETETLCYLFQVLCIIPNSAFIVMLIPLASYPGLMAWQRRDYGVLFGVNGEGEGGEGEGLVDARPYVDMMRIVATDSLAFLGLTRTSTHVLRIAADVMRKTIRGKNAQAFKRWCLPERIYGSRELFALNTIMFAHMCIFAPLNPWNAFVAALFLITHKLMRMVRIRFLYADAEDTASHDDRVLPVAVAALSPFAALCHVFLLAPLALRYTLTALTGLAVTGTVVTTWEIWRKLTQRRLMLRCKAFDNDEPYVEPPAPSSCTPLAHNQLNDDMLAQHEQQHQQQPDQRADDDAHETGQGGGEGEEAQGGATSPEDGAQGGGADEATPMNRSTSQLEVDLGGTTSVPVTRFRQDLDVQMEAISSRSDPAAAAAAAAVADFAYQIDILSPPCSPTLPIDPWFQSIRSRPPDCPPSAPPAPVAHFPAPMSFVALMDGARPGFTEAYPSTTGGSSSKMQPTSCADEEEGDRRSSDSTPMQRPRTIRRSSPELSPPSDAPTSVLSPCASPHPSVRRSAPAVPPLDLSKLIRPPGTVARRPGAFPPVTLINIGGGVMSSPSVVRSDSESTLGGGG
ncbi:unnamed protein product [Vitrella brassicaformis CCMP3155]|uniref:Uncharacterized protein n=3 Tax=Vitrella brassicaformis TaxID=1169539 RepID=A0A0G4GWD4_VITBC|nr:unnamed protein product [Vitrella brassicaformis CCMP3155]|eukprot:CEM35290.1 unnamed protein product [Vitrella brassicaformis CCMP3155]